MRTFTEDRLRIKIALAFLLGFGPGAFAASLKPGCTKPEREVVSASRSKSESPAFQCPSSSRSRARPGNETMPKELVTFVR